MARAAARCRVCRTRLDPAPLLLLANMPGSAQGFPSAETLAADRGDDLAIHQCPGCGLLQLPGAPVPYYREVIRAAAYSPEMRQFRLEQFADWRRRFPLSEGRLLEVGCGRGEYLSLLRQAGFDAHGIEWSQGNLAACRQAGLSARRAFPARAGQRLPGGPYAAFASFNFMEHWPDPVASLAALRYNLNPDGLGFVEVPNADMVMARALYSEFIRDHLCYFTADTLRLTVQLAGFELIECRPVWHDYILSAVVRRRPARDATALMHRQHAMRRQLEEFITAFPAGQVAVWGAGHQALATLALSGIADRIRYVVDSAPFKQGKFTPATHLPIVPPERLNDEPVQAVIVMAAAYSDEVARQIRARFAPSLAVRILRDEQLEPA